MSLPATSALEPDGVTVIGAGPAGLMAAQALADAGVPVQVLDAMPSVGRKFLLAGKGGLNLTHAEDPVRFATRYADAQGHSLPVVDDWLAAFGPPAVRDWAAGLGIETFVGSSGRVFPRDLKAAPLLRAWLHRLRGQGVRLRMRHRFLGWDAQGRWRLATPSGEQTLPADARVVLALGGASWRRLGSDGAWWPWLAARGVALAPLVPSNVGFDVPAPGWSERLREQHAGAPLKNVVLTVPASADGPGPSGASEGLAESEPGIDAVTEPLFRARGECVLTATGLEGSLVYAASGAIRRRLEAAGGAPVTVWLDLLPDRDPAFVLAEVSRPRGSRSLATHLKSRLNIDGVRAALVFEAIGRDGLADPRRLAAALKALPVRLAAARPLDEAISTAGGVRLSGLDAAGVHPALPTVHFAGEMLDWDAPTGGYLLTACLASGHRAGQAAARAWATGSGVASTSTPASTD